MMRVLATSHQELQVKAMEVPTIHRWSIVDPSLIWPVPICDTFAAGCAHMCVCIHMCICMHMYMDAYVCLWYCLTCWGVVAEIFCLCIGVHVHVCVYVCACMRVYVYVHMYVYIYMRVCVHVCIYIYIHTRVGVHMHSCRRILFISTFQSLYYMRVYDRCFFYTCMRVWWGIGSGIFPACSWLAHVAGVGGYVLARVEIGVLPCIFLYLCRC